MGLPGDTLAIAIFVVLALPGLIHAAVRRWARGESAGDRDLGLSIARGTVFAVLLTSIYLLAFPHELFSGLTVGSAGKGISIVDPKNVAIKVLALYIAIPTALALLLNVQHLRWAPPTRRQWLPVLRSKHGYTTRPTAWDHAVLENNPAWVRIQRTNGKWFGGAFTGNSFATTYPEPRSIYLDRQYSVDDNGEFGEHIPNTGLYLAITDDDVVIWTKPSLPSSPGKGTS